MAEAEWVRIVNEARVLSERVLEDRTRLIGRTPHVGREAWLHIVFRGLKEEEIQTLEAQLALRLPDEVRTFLAQQNGLSVFSDAMSLDGLRTSYVRAGDAAYQPYSIVPPNIDERPAFAPDSAFFLGGYSSDGSLLYIDQALAGRVFRCARDSGEILNEWTTLSEMLDNEVRRLAALFDMHGRRLDPDRPRKRGKA